MKTRDTPFAEQSVIDNRWSLTLTAAAAPIVWGSTYLVTTEFLPADRPMTASVLRALPAGILLLAISPGFPPVGWRVRTFVLGLLNIGFFFPLLFLAAYRLPGGLAAVVGSIQPLIIAAVSLVFGWGKPRKVQMGWALVAVLGVALVAITGQATVDIVGLAAATAGTLSMAIGLVLTRRWGVAPTMHPLTSTAWQLIVGGIVILPLIPFLDTGPWYLDASATLGYLWLSIVGGAAAYAVWFRGARALPSTNMALLGILSPLTAAILGWVFLGQSLSILQSIGFALALAGSMLGQLNKPQPALQQQNSFVPTDIGLRK